MKFHIFRRNLAEFNDYPNADTFILRDGNLHRVSGFSLIIPKGKRPIIVLTCEDVPTPEQEIHLY